jgi:peptidoglycan/LPS O-acetylase OafA/YrhL
MLHDEPAYHTDHRRLDRLDHLRFLAASAVASWHFTQRFVPSSAVPKWPIFSIFEEGYTGVSLFCTISGFIFSWLYFGKEISIASFAKNRALRIMPLYFFFIALTFYTQGGFTGLDVLAAFTTLLSSGFPGFASPGWTIIIELQFYALFPALMLFTRKYGVGYLLAFLAFMVLFRALVWQASGNSQSLAYWTIFGRMDQFLAGIITAIILKRTMQRRDVRIATIVLGMIGSVAIVSFAHYLNVNGGFNNLYGANGASQSGLWVIYPTIEAVCYASIIAGYVVMPPIRGRLAAAIDAAFSYCGRISYSIYLTHFLLIAAVFQFLVSHGVTATTWEGAVVLFLITALPAIIAVSSATYCLIERPFFDLRQSALPSGGELHHVPAEYRQVRSVRHPR